MDEGLLNDLLECSVCLERLDTSSRVLPCQHTFCIKCLKEIVHSHKELRCPECRVLVEVKVEELPPNVLLMRILEGMRNSAPRRLGPPTARPLQKVAPASPAGHPAPGFTYSSGQGDGGKQTYVMPASTPHARAVYDYLSKEPGDLSFKKGDVIILRRRIDSHWYHGESGGKQGAFPITYAQIQVPLPPAVPQCKALYDFQMAAPDEDGCLAFDKGAVITVIRRVDENWAEGRLEDRIGIFPIAFVEMNAPARSLMKLSSNSAASSSRVAPPTPPADSSSRSIMGANALIHHAQGAQRVFLANHNHNKIQQMHSAYRQQQMSLSSPVPAIGSPQQPQNMSQSHPNYLHQHPATTTPCQTPLQGTHTGPYVDLIELAERVRSAQNQSAYSSIPSQTPNNQTQTSTQAKTGNSLQDSAQSSSQQRNVKQFTNLSSSYHATNNLSSDSSSTTTTPSFGGSSVTTTPNTSSSNTSSASESNTPSSPASPVYSSQGRTNVSNTTTDVNATLSNTIVSQSNQSSNQNNYYNVSPSLNQTLTPQRSASSHVVRDDANALNSRSHDVSLDSGNISQVANTSSPSDLNRTALQQASSNNSPVQNTSSNTLNATPPRSNMSSPQTCNQNNTVSSASQQPVSTESTSVSSQVAAHQNMINRHTGPNHNAFHGSFSNSGYMLMSNNHTGNPFLNTNVLNSTPEGQVSSSNGQSYSTFYLNEPGAVSEGGHHGMISPRPGRDGPLVSVARSSHSHHHRDKEKRHSLTPGGQVLVPQHTSHNRHSAEILSPTNSLLDLEPSPDRPTTKRTEGDGREREASDKRERDKHRKRSGSADRQLPASYVALYPYKPQKADELELKKGGIYMVLERCQDGWYKGCSNRTKICGVFPGNYVVPAHKGAQPTHRHQPQEPKTPTSSSSSVKPSSASSSPGVAGLSAKGRGTAEGFQQLLPPDLPPRSLSPGASNSSNANSSQGFPWSSTPKAASGSKSSDKSKDKNKQEKAASSGVSLMRRLAAMKKCRSPPPSGTAAFSLDNPVFEDCSPQPQASTPTTHHAVHVRSGSCPSQLLQGPPSSISPLDLHQLQAHHQQHQANGMFSAQLTSGGSVSSAVAHRLFPAQAKPGSQTLGPSQAPQRRQTRPSVLNAMGVDAAATLSPGNKQGYPVGRSSGDVPWLPVSTRHHHHRKSHSLDAGQQLRPNGPKESTATVVRERFRCIVAYPPNSEYELELRVDDVVIVHKKWGDGWYKGTLERTGRTGLFPASFVESC